MYGIRGPLRLFHVGFDSSGGAGEALEGWTVGRQKAERGDDDVGLKDKKRISLKVTRLKKRR